MRASPGTVGARDGRPTERDIVHDRAGLATDLEHAEIADGYDTGVTLRQCFYRLVADGTPAEHHTAYKGLSAGTGRAA